MNLPEPAQRGMCSCLTLILSVILLCGLVALFGQPVALPGLLVWLVLAGYLIYIMVMSIRRGQAESPALPGGRVNGSARVGVPEPIGAPTPHPFRDWLIEQMIAQNLTAMSLALQLAIRDDIVDGWVQGRGLPSPIECARLAAFFGVPERDVMRLAGWSR